MPKQTFDPLKVNWYHSPTRGLYTLIFPMARAIGNDTTNTLTLFKEMVEQPSRFHDLVDKVVDVRFFHTVPKLDDFNPESHSRTSMKIDAWPEGHKSKGNEEKLLGFPNNYINVNWGNAVLGSYAEPYKIEIPDLLPRQVAPVR